MNQNIFKSLGLAVVIVSLSLLTTNIFAEDQAVIEVHQLNDLANITVKSSVNIQEYQIVIFKEGNITGDVSVFGTLWNDIILEGFMTNSIQLNSENQYRWFNLETAGHGGSLTLIFDGCITIDRVNMLDSDGNIVPAIGLPKTLCE